MRIQMIVNMLLYAFSWMSIFILSWLMILGRVENDLLSWFFLTWFFFCALMGDAGVRATVKKDVKNELD